jgi:hypothetical protein
VKQAKALLLTPPTSDGGAPPEVVLPAIGAAFGGGYYAGKMSYPDGIYALVIAPKASGESSGITYSNTGVVFSGNTSLYDGWAIRANMIAAGIDNFPAQKACSQLTIGGFSDWYLPAREELELCYRNLKPTTGTNVTSAGDTLNTVPPYGKYTTTNPLQTTVTAFRATAGAQRFASDYYWHASYSGDPVDQGQVIRFTNGARAVTLQNDTYYARAVRRVYVSAT